MADDMPRGRHDDAIPRDTAAAIQDDLFGDASDDVGLFIIHAG